MGQSVVVECGIGVLGLFLICYDVLLTRENGGGDENKVRWVGEREMGIVGGGKWA